MSEANQNKLMDHICIEADIVCNKCGATEHEFATDEYMFAEQLDFEGWYVNRNNSVVCPKCDKRKKRR